MSYEINNLGGAGSDYSWLRETYTGNGGHGQGANAGDIGDFRPAGLGGKSVAEFCSGYGMSTDCGSALDINTILKQMKASADTQRQNFARIDKELKDEDFTTQLGKATPQSDRDAVKTLADSNSLWANNPGVNGDKTKLSLDYLKNVASSDSSSGYDAKTVAAAKYFVAHPELATGVGKSSNKAAPDSTVFSATGMNDYVRNIPESGAEAAKTLLYSKDANIFDSKDSLTTDKLKEIANNTNGAYSDDVVGAAKYLVAHPHELNALDEADGVKDADAKFNKQGFQAYINTQSKFDPADVPQTAAEASLALSDSKTLWANISGPDKSTVDIDYLTKVAKSDPSDSEYDAKTIAAAQYFLSHRKEHAGWENKTTFTQREIEDGVYASGKDASTALLNANDVWNSNNPNGDKNAVTVAYMNEIAQSKAADGKFSAATIAAARYIMSHPGLWRSIETADTGNAHIDDYAGKSAFQDYNSQH